MTFRKQSFLYILSSAVLGCSLACDGGGTSGTGVGGGGGSATISSEETDLAPAVCGQVRGADGFGISGAIVESPFSGQAVLTNKDGNFVVILSRPEPTLIVHTKNNVEQVYFSLEALFEGQTLSLEGGDEIGLVPCSEIEVSVNVNHDGGT